MKRNDAEQIGKLIQQYLRQESLESPLNEQRLLDAWPQVLGPAGRNTTKTYIRNYRRQAIPVISISVTRRCMYISLPPPFVRN